MGFGNLANPYVENTMVGWIVNVHWKKRGRIVGGTCVGSFGYSFGLGDITIQVGIINPDTGDMLGSSSSVSLSVGHADVLTASASGSLIADQSTGVSPYVQISGAFVESGLFYFQNPPGFAFFSSDISNSGDLSPFGQVIGMTGAGTWTADITFHAVATGFSSGGTGTISVVLSPL